MAQMTQRLHAASGIPVLLLAGSGCGKSTFVAQLVKKERVAEAFDVIIAVFVGATDGSTQIFKVLSAVCSALMAAIPDLARNLPDDAMGLQQAFHALLQGACEEEKRVLLVFDAVNELEPHHNARSLGWLPKKLPGGVTILATAIDSSCLVGNETDTKAACLQVLAAFEKHWGLVQGSDSVQQLEDLDKVQLGDLLQQLLAQQSSDRQLTEEDIGLILQQEGASSPLFLKLFAQKLALHPDATSTLVSGFPSTPALIFQQTLSELQATFGTSVAVVVVSVYCAGSGGLLIEQVFQLLENSLTQAQLQGGQPGSFTLQLWAEMMKNGLSTMIHVVSGVPHTLLGFVHMQARDAVAAFFLQTSQDYVDGHKNLATYFETTADPAGKGTFSGLVQLPLTVKRQVLCRLPQHLCSSGNEARLVHILCSLNFCEQKFAAGLAAELIEDFNRFRSAFSFTSQEVKDFSDFVRASMHILAEHPSLIWQEAENQPDASAVYNFQQPVEKTSTGMRQVKWVNKPQQRSACVGTQLIPGPVWALSFSPQGDFVAIAGSDELVHVLNTSNGDEVCALSGHSDDAQLVMFDPTNANCLITISSKELFVWDVQSAQVTQTAELNGFALCMDWSITNSSHVCVMCNVRRATSLVLLCRDTLKELKKWDLQGTGNGCAISPDGEQVACGIGERVAIYNKSAGVEQVHLLERGDEDEDSIRMIRSVVWAAGADKAGREMIAAGAADGNICIWHCTEKVWEISQILACGDDISNICYARNQLLAAADKQMVILEPDSKSWKEIAKLAGHSQSIRQINMHPLQPLAYTASDDGTVRHWHLDYARDTKPPPGHTESVTACVWCEVQRTFISADGAGVAKCWDEACAKELWHLHISPVDFSCKAIVSLAVAGRQVACAMFKKVTLVSVSDGIIHSELQCTDWQNSLAVSSDQKYLLGGGDRGSLVLWAAQADASWEQEVVFSGVRGDVLGCAVTETKVASCGNECCVQIWGFSGELLITLDECPSWLFSVCFTPAGDKVAASMSGSGALFIWDAESGKLLCSKSNVQPAKALGWCCFCEQGKFLLSSSAAKVVGLWAQSGEALAPCAIFPALGSFGSPDGIGGQGAVLVTGKGVTTVVIGDQGGRLYRLEL
jgi:WD40 repeat protein